MNDKKITLSLTPGATVLGIAGAVAVAAAVGGSTLMARRPAAEASPMPSAAAAAPAAAGGAAIPLNGANFDGAYAPVKSAPGDKAKLSGELAPGWFDNSGWAEVTLSYAKEPSGGRGGGAAQRVKIGAVNGFGQMQLAQAAQLTPGPVSASVWVKADAENVPVTLAVRDVAGNKMAAEKTVSVGKAWTEIKAEGTSGDGTHFLLLIAKRPDTTLWFDDAALARGGVAAAAAVAATTAATPPRSVSGAWGFDPERDRFSPAALLDLRYLNEKVAGENGFITATADGDFARGDGQPIRFWAVTEYSQRSDDPKVLPHKARWLAKRGVNMVRAHSEVQIAGEDNPSPGAPLDALNEKEIDQIWRLVAAMKKEGIYTTISPYWANVGTKTTGKNAHGRLFFDPELQRAYKSWMRALYSRPNPHTGIPLAKDPAVAIIQLQNEDSMLFWTMQAIKGPTLGMARKAYGDWLAKKYGSLDKANAAWGGDKPGPGEFQDNQGDEPGAGRMGLYIVWAWTPEGRKQYTPDSYKGRRAADQLAFYVEQMASFNREMARFFRQELGAKQIINAGNWRPADPTLLMDAERISYLPNEVIGTNRYFDSGHEGPDNGWAIRAGDKFSNNSATYDPRGLPINLKQVAGRPIAVFETEWVYPNMYQSEGALLTAAYQSLTGVDASYFFAAGENDEWQPPLSPKVGDWQPPLGKWSINTPMQMGMFPAAALLFRQGYVKKGAVAVHEERALTDVWNGYTPLIAEEAGYDPNRDNGPLPPRSAVTTRVSPLSFLVGPVEVVYGGDPAKSRVHPDLSKLIDEKNKVVASNTGEVRLNWGKGLCVVNAPKAQAATGFLTNAGGPIRLADVTIDARNDYATVAVVAMDNTPLKTSKKVLVQVGTLARPTGWQEKIEEDGAEPIKTKYRIVDPGGNPWLVTHADLRVTVANPTLTKASVLDANGEVTGTLPLTKSGGGVSLSFPKDALYVVLQ